MIKKTLLLLLTCMLPVSYSAHAELAVGQKLTHDLSATNQHGEEQTFDALKGDKGLVLVFVRSADWCPYCKTQLVEMNHAYDDIQTLGYGIASISYDDRSALDAFSKKNAIRYPMLSDENSEIIKTFGILNEEMKPGTRFYGIPHPAIYIVGADGVVQARLAEEGYKKRPPASLIISQIKSIHSK